MLNSYKSVLTTNESTLILLVYFYCSIVTNMFQPVIQPPLPVLVAARLLRSWVRIPPGAWMFVCCECCVLSGRGFCNELITHPEEYYQLWCIIVRDQETSRVRKPWPTLGHSTTGKKKSSHLQGNFFDTKIQL